MIEYLNHEVRSWLERKGLEEDVMSHRDDNLYIEVNDVEEAFQRALAAGRLNVDSGSPDGL